MILVLHYIINYINKTYWCKDLQILLELKKTKAQLTNRGRKYNALSKDIRENYFCLFKNNSLSLIQRCSIFSLSSYVALWK